MGLLFLSAHAGRGIGTRLWIEVEEILRKYDIAIVRGIVGAAPGINGVSKLEMARARNFWRKHAGCSISPKDRIYKNLRRLERNIQSDTK